MKKRKQFATVPFGLNTYGAKTPSAMDLKLDPPATDPADGLEQLRRLLNLFKQGDFSLKPQLIPLLSSRSRDVRLYATQLFADVASHDDLRTMQEVTLSASQDAGEFRMKLVSMAYTLSPLAVESLLQVRNAIGGLKLDESIVDAVSILLSDDVVDNVETDDGLDTVLIESAASGLLTDVYYARGTPVNLLELNEQAMQAAEQAYATKKGFVYSLHPRLLSNFTGEPCPVDYGMQVDATLRLAIAEYVERVQAFKWEPGVKYFYRNRIE